MLTNVETAIDALVLKGIAEVEIEGRRFRMANLAELVAWRNTLKNEVTAATAGGRVRFASFEDFR